MTDDVFCLSPQVVVEAFDDGALVLRVNDRCIFELNLTARDVLARTDGQSSAAQIAAILAGEYQIPEQEAMQDVVELYEQLAAQKLVELVETVKNRKENS